MREGEGHGILCRTKHGREVGMEVGSGEGGWGRGVLRKKEKKSREKERKWDLKTVKFLCEAGFILRGRLGVPKVSRVIQMFISSLSTSDLGPVP